MTDEIEAIRRYFEAEPAPVDATRELVAARLAPLWAPPGQTSGSTGSNRPAARRRLKRRPWRVATAVGLVVAAGGAGAGIAAATGVFDSEAHGAFVRAATAHSAEVGHAARRPMSTPPTTTADPSANPGAERVEVTAPGPDGSTLQLVTTPERGAAGICYVVTTTDPGAAIEPGKPPYTPAPLCLANTALGILGDSSDSLWVSATGARYMITVGRAAGAATIEIVARHWATVDAQVNNGWYVVALPYGFDQTSHTEMARSSSGRTIGVAHR
jgi:hypothetical protein